MREKQQKAPGGEYSSIRRSTKPETEPQPRFERPAGGVSDEIETRVPYLNYLHEERQAVPRSPRAYCRIV